VLVIFPVRVTSSLRDIGRRSLVRSCRRAASMPPNKPNLQQSAAVGGWRSGQVFLLGCVRGSDLPLLI
jgi:hypothetical protein